MRFRPALLLLALIATPLTAEPLVPSKVDALVQPYLDEKDFVGCVVGILQDGKARTFAYGEIEKGAGRKPDADTLYEIGSTTKVFTAVLLADLVRRGEVKLTDPLQSLLPADRVTVPKRNDKFVTLEQVATHGSGLPRMPNNFKPADPKNPYADYTIEQAFASLNGYTMKRDPGEAYEYSNLAMGVMGYGLAQKEKTTYEQLVIERICKPLKMDDTRITLDADRLKRVAAPYREDLEPSHLWDIPGLAGAGALRSSVNDMLKFLAANLAGDEAPLTQSMRLAQERRVKFPDGPGMALGWHIARDRETRWHNGQTGGYHAFMAVNRQKNAAIVILCNTATTKVDPLGENLMRLAAGGEPQVPVRRKAISVDEATLQKYVGVYPMSPLFALTVTCEEGKLMVKATGQPKIEVFAESKTKFFYKVVDAQITFIEGKDGAVTGLVLHQGGQNMPAQRAK